MSFKVIGFAVAVIAITLGGLNYSISRREIPEHMLHHPAHAIPNLISESHFKELNQLMRQMKEFPSNVDDLTTTGFIPKHEHIGEAQPINPDGTCSHNLLVPSINKSSCILPQRIDIGKHFIMTGGPEAIREPFDKMVSRLNSFGRYMFNVIEQYPVVNDLFNQPIFQNTAKSVCPADQQVLDPFQFNFIMQVPGQTVAMHIDGAYFWGATRKQIPQWLLACMVFSGKFQNEFINQVQVVGYLHEWNPQDRSNVSNGDFIYYDSNDLVNGEKIIPPTPRAGTIVDGSKVVHAAKIYRAEVNAPKIGKDEKSKLVFNEENGRWDLVVGNEVRNSYDNSDLRVSIVYRARCFRSEEEKKLFYNLPEDKYMKLENVLSTLKDDLASKPSARYSREDLDKMETLELAFVLLDSYIKYPLPAISTTLIPLNYCALARLYPWTANLLKFVC
jgi:hypothetical protein